MSNKLTDDVVVTQYTLQKLKTVVQTALGAAIAEDIRVESHEEAMIQALVVKLQTYVLAENIMTKRIPVTFKDKWYTPRTTWQFWKMMHAPGWFIKRFPVKYDETKTSHTKYVNLKRYATYPHSNLITKDKRLAFDNVMGSPVIKDVVEVEE